MAEMKSRDSMFDLLSLETSRRNTDIIADIVVQKPELFEELFGIFASNRDPVSRRAAWVIDIVSETHPAFIEPHLGDLVDLLPGFTHDAPKRHSLRILSRSPLPDPERMGKLITICFDLLASRQSSVSEKVYSMELLYRFSEIEPDLRQELADTIEWRLEEETAGVKNRGRKLLKKLNHAHGVSQKK
jgi:hypothetical protein